MRGMLDIIVLFTVVVVGRYNTDECVFHCTCKFFANKQHHVHILVLFTFATSSSTIYYRYNISTNWAPCATISPLCLLILIRYLQILSMRRGALPLVLPPSHIFHTHIFYVLTYFLLLYFIYKNFYRPIKIYLRFICTVRENFVSL